MSSPTLISLPPELLFDIYDYLDYEHPKSVLALAHTCKYCYFVAAPRILRDAEFRFSSFCDQDEDVNMSLEMNPAEYVETYIQKLQERGIPRHIRRLTIEWTPTTHESTLERPCSVKFPYKSDSVFESGEPFEDLMSVNPCPQDLKYIDHKVEFPWRILARFIEKLSSLKELVYSCPETFPPCLLKTLHKHQSHCKLHVNFFLLRSCHNRALNTHEQALVSSPCLYSIRVVPNKSDEEYPLSKSHAKAIMTRVITRAPNLRNLFMADNGTSDKWNLLGRPNKNQPPLGSLKCLSLSIRTDSCLPSYFNRHVIKNWAATVKFSRLKVLNLGSPLKKDALDLLVNSKFSSLKSLRLSLPAARRHYNRPSNAYTRQMSRFLCGLRPLSSFCIYDWSNGLRLDSFIARHGRSLQSLSVFAVFGRYLDDGLVGRIVRECHSMTELCIPVRRDMNLYFPGFRALGSLKNLEHLELKLITFETTLLADQYMTEPRLRFGRESHLPFSYKLEQDMDEFRGSNIRHLHVRNAFANTALDETLACEIFRIISSAKPPGAVPFQTLNVSTDSDCMRETVLQWIVDEISSPWIVERNPVAGAENNVVAKKGLLRWDRLSYREDEKCNIKFSEHYEGIFRSLWPTKTLEKHDPSWDGPHGWWDDWKSFPYSRV
ncbi:hypothetical protein FE257_003288 [Aspergillus nanangensis]|uniref:F-box domain-containing protein n=1 Tax=Aspergillus nanangensis TaxID=2582783 RepID=A0AAD4GWE9_ASPNN|nr:hypothetical protein FE257_003288 [Aspergillus nanangensis]